MQIVINNLLSVVNHSGKNLLPGTNVVESIESNHPIFKKYVDECQMEIIDVEKSSKNEKLRAIARATTKLTLDSLKLLIGKENAFKDAFSTAYENIASFEKEIENADSAKTAE
jgi:hypothetical protein